MKGREIWREAARNFGAGATRGVISVLAFLAIVGGFAVVATRGVVGVSAEAASFREAGASVFRLDSPGNIDGGDCDALSEIPGIAAAGATRAGAPVRFALLPGLPTPYFDATPGMGKLLGIQNEPSEAGLILDSRTLHALGLANTPSRAYLVGADAPTPIAASFAHPDDGRDSTLSGAAISVSVSDEPPFDSCWARFWPPTDSPGELLGTAAVRSVGINETIQWNSTLGNAFDPTARFFSLPTPASILGAITVASALAFTNVSLRRLEFSSARHIGVSRRSLMGIVLAEITIWCAPACAFALTMLGFAASWHNPDPPLAAWIAGLRVVAAASAAWFVTTAIAVGAIRERRLVRYFQRH